MLIPGAAGCKGADVHAVSDVWLRRTDRTSCGQPRRTGCHTVQSKLTVKARTWSTSSALPLLESYHPLCDLRPFVDLNPNGGRSLASGCSSSVWNIAFCTWNGQVETDALSRFSRMAMLTHDALQVRAWDSPQPYSQTARVSALIFFTTGIQPYGQTARVSAL